MTSEFIHTEKITSKKTSNLFLRLTGLIFFRFTSRWMVSGMHGLTIVFLCLFIIFLFCSANYRILNITLTRKELALIFGLVTRVIPPGNITSCWLDEIPILMRNGGAGVHFMFRYWASLNFFEFPRVVLSLRKSFGPVQDISFITREPDRWIRLLWELSSTTTHQGNQ